MIWSCTQYVHTRVTTKHVNGMIINNSIKKKKKREYDYNNLDRFFKTTIKKTKTKENYSEWIKIIFTINEKINRIFMICHAYTLMFLL